MSQSSKPKPMIQIKPKPKITLIRPPTPQIWVIPKRVHLKKVKGVVQSPYDLYVGRRLNNPQWRLEGSIWGNPYVLKDESQRDSVINQYRDYVRSKPELLSQLKDLSGKRIGCFCPLDKHCHTEVLIELFKEYVMGITNK